jgi:hypothetical protein
MRRCRVAQSCGRGFSRDAVLGFAVVFGIGVSRLKPLLLFFGTAPGG